jgi:hypothetical protein
MSDVIKNYHALRQRLKSNSKNKSYESLEVGVKLFYLCTTPQGRNAGNSNEKTKLEMV